MHESGECLLVEVTRISQVTEAVEATMQTQLVRQALL